MLDDRKVAGDHIEPAYPGNITSLTSTEGLPMIFAYTDLKEFLTSWSKEQQSNATQYCEPIFGDPSASTSAAPKVMINQKGQSLLLVFLILK